MRTRSFDDYLVRRLRDPEFAIAYLREALSEGVDEYYQALAEIEIANNPPISVNTPANPSQKERIPVTR